MTTVGAADAGAVDLLYLRSRNVFKMVETVRPITGKSTGPKATKLNICEY